MILIMVIIIFKYFGYNFSIYIILIYMCDTFLTTVLKLLWIQNIIQISRLLEYIAIRNR